MEEVNQQGTSISDAAAAINALKQPVEEASPEVEAVTEEVIQEEVITESVEPVSEDVEIEASEETEQVTDESEEELQSWQSLDELMEAAGLDHEKFDKLVTKRKINGVEEEVTLAELRSGNQRDEDYRRKTMELSEHRKELEETQAKFEQEQQAKVQHTDLLIQQLNNQLVGEYQSINWAELEQSDPGLYALKKVQFQEKQQQLNQAFQVNDQERTRLTEQQQFKQQQENANYLQEQEKLLLSKIPEWSNEEVRLKGQTEIRDYMQLQGFNEQEIASTADHRHVLLLQKAMAYDSLNKKAAPKLNKVTHLPKVVKPGATVSKKEAQLTNTSQLKQRARKTGDIRDAAALIGALRK